jgi:hypothetical protein
VDALLILLTVAAGLFAIAAARAAIRRAEVAMPRPDWLPHAILVGAGVALVAFAYVRAGSVAEAADADFWEYVRSRGGSLTSAPGFPESYRQMAAGGRLLQCGLVGGCGLVLFGVGCLGLTRRGTGGRTEPGSATHSGE